MFACLFVVLNKIVRLKVVGIENFAWKVQIQTFSFGLMSLANKFDISDQSEIVKVTSTCKADIKGSSDFDLLILI